MRSRMPKEVEADGGDDLPLCSCRAVVGAAGIEVPERGRTGLVVDVEGLVGSERS